MNVHSRIRRTAIRVNRPAPVAIAGAVRYHRRLALMHVNQIDARTVRVRTPEASFRLPYRLWWNGHERRPESIVVRSQKRGTEVQAFFLFATVRDLITSEAGAIDLRRSWSIASPEPARLSIGVAFERQGKASYLLPGAAMGAGLPAEPVSVAGLRTALPSAAYLFIGGQGILAYVEAASAPTGIGVWQGSARREGPGEEEEPALPTIEVSLPLVACRTGHMGEQSGSQGERWPQTVAFADGLEASCAIRLLFAPRGDIVLRGARAMVTPGRTGGLARRTVPDLPSDRDAIVTAIERCLDSHLVLQGGVAGLRDLPASSVLSSEAAAGMAVLLRLLFPGDAERGELALRLADFCLKGQHPCGLLYEDYDVRRCAWSGARGRAPSPVIAVARSARIADRLLLLADSLEGEGRPGEKYRLAGLRFVEFFFEGRGAPKLPGSLHRPGQRVPEESGLAGLEVFFPLARLYRRTGRDRYYKALSALASELGRLPWGTPWLPSSRQGREPDAAAALLCARVAAESHSAGLAPVSARDAAAVLAPWIFLGAREAVEEIDPAGALIDSFHRQRLLCAGAETARALEGLRRLTREPRLARTLDGLARLCRSFAVRVPLGTAWLLHAPQALPSPALGEESGVARPRSIDRPAVLGWRRGRTTTPSRVGPNDSRRLVREVCCLLEVE